MRLREELELSVFENRVLKKIFEPKRDEAAMEFYGPYCLLNTIRLVKSAKIRLAGHVERDE